MQLRAVSTMTSVLSFARGPGFEARQAERHEVTDLEVWTDHHRLIASRLVRQHRAGELRDGKVWPEWVHADARQGR